MGLTPALAAWSRLGAVDRPGTASGRRFVIVHLDGVSRKALHLALRAGLMPTLSRWLNQGSHSLLPTYSGAPASTPAFQAALFYGERGDCPGYHWHDKKRDKAVRMDDSREVYRYEASLKKSGEGILRGGSTYFSIIGGEAEEPAFAMSRLARGLPWGGYDDFQKNGWDRLASWLAHAVPLIRSAARLIGMAPSGLLESLAWSMEKGTFKNEPRYLLHRFLLAQLAHELTTYLTVLDICRGVPAIYSVYAGYDEVAHRRGPYSSDALRQLIHADHAIRMIGEAIELRPESRYDLFILSDHGQEETTPAEKLLGGARLMDWVLTGGKRKKLSRNDSQPQEDTNPFHPFCGSRLDLGGGEDGQPPLVVAEAGDLAHIYFKDMEAAHDLETLVKRWPKQLRAVLECPASGIVAVRGGRSGFAFLRGKRIDLAEAGTLKGFLEYDPEQLRRALIEMISTPSAGDIVVFGAGVSGGDVAYAWEFGSHGGVGSGDVESFLIHPSTIDLSALRQAGPVELHHFFRTRYLEHPDESQWRS